jgi:hypothetical protein
MEFEVFEEMKFHREGMIQPRGSNYKFYENIQNYR